MQHSTVPSARPMTRRVHTPNCLDKYPLKQQNIDWFNKVYFNPDNLSIGLPTHFHLLEESNLMRQQCSLSGSWQFQLDPEGSLTVESLAPDREVPVPLPWQAALPELEQYSGYAWYRRYVNLAEDWLRGE